MRAERIAPVLFMLAIAGACSGNDQTATVAGAGNSAGFNPTGSGASAGSFNPTGAGGSANGTGSGGSGGIVDADGGCPKGTSQASLAQLTMFVMFDDSGSMADNNKWTLASGAMRTFFADPSTAGMKVWLRLFPSNTPTMGCTKSSCDGECTNNCTVASFPTSTAACSNPQVPVGALTAATGAADPQEQKLVAALPANLALGSSTGGTPMSAALAGVEKAAADYVAANPADKAHTVVVLVTDGQPNGCDETIADIAKIAGDQLAATGIKTYAIGLQGSAQTDMQAIATAGSTTAVFIGNAGTTQADLLAAFGAIQTANASCDFDVPTPPVGLTLNPDYVNVNYTTGAGMLNTLPKSADLASCGTQQAWYYTNNQTHITLCPSACSTVKADPGARVDVLFSCNKTCLATDPTCIIK